MIEINLLPEEHKKKRKKIELPEIPIIPVTVFLLAVLVLIQILLNTSAFISKKQLAALEKELGKLAPKKKVIDGLRKNVSITGKKVEAIEELVGKRFRWTRLLNELSNSMTPNIWLTELKYDEKSEMYTMAEAPPAGAGGAKGDAGKPKPQQPPQYKRTLRTLTLSGSATGKGEEGTTYVARFIQAMKDNKAFFKDFDDIELVSIKTGSIAGSDVMNFILLCRFKPEVAK